MTQIKPRQYAQVLIPLAVRDTYIYSIPPGMEPAVKFGVRAEVPFGKRKHYAGLIVGVTAEEPTYRTKEILSVIDQDPVITLQQFAFWKWMASYYASSLGEIMHAALPARMKLSSETVVMPSGSLADHYFELEDHEYTIAKALLGREQLNMDQIRELVANKASYAMVNSMFDRGLILVKEELQIRYKPKITSFVRLGRAYRDEPDKEKIFNSLKRAEKQTQALLAFIHLAKEKDIVALEQIIRMANVSRAVIKALHDKQILEVFDRQVSRLGHDPDNDSADMELSEQQDQALKKILETFKKNKPAVLFGVTGSGKTHIYLKLIDEALKDGKQVLYLLPEIALTTHMVDRVRQFIGDELLVFHSRLNENERVEVWQAVLDGRKVILGARSALFLPFKNLGLIIVDEEHDSAFKQEDPAPRYQARDASVWLSQYLGANIILGSATPSLETYVNSSLGKYQMTELTERYGDLQLPEIIIADMKKERRKEQMLHFSQILLDEIDQTLKEGFQVILFKNRRGFAPLMLCGNCGWTSQCHQCDNALTFHKYTDQMQCHFCGHREKPPLVCPACGNYEMVLKGFGTQLLEDEIKSGYPHVRVGRLDLDSARGKKNMERILYMFSQKSYDLLIGTQMVTKGLDFENVGLVGILSADHMLYFPDFRATERAFQLMVQVGGRAGRKHRRGKVVIQTFNTTHPVIKDVLHNDYISFVSREIKERREFLYPPFIRMIRLTLKHKKISALQRAEVFFRNRLISELGKRLHGPARPPVSKVRNFYLSEFIIKMEKDPSKMKWVKDTIEHSIILLKKQAEMSTLRVVVNVDP